MAGTDDGFKNKADAVMAPAVNYFQVCERLAVLQKEIEVTGNNDVRQAAVRDLLLQRIRAATVVADRVVNLLLFEGVSLSSTLSSKESDNDIR